MKQGINLSLGRKRVDYALRKFYYVSVVAFCLCVVLSLALITYRLVLKGFYEDLSRREEAINTKLLVIQEKKDKFLETKSRLSDARSVISKRSPLINQINTFSQIIPTDSVVNSLNGSDESIRMAIESENLVSLNDLLEQKIEQLASDRNKGISKIEMRTFGLNPKTLKYTISFEIFFK